MNSKGVRTKFRDKYMTEIPNHMEKGVKDYLRSLVQGDTHQRRTLFAIAGNHESETCRKWSVEYIRTFTLPEDKKDFVDMWIRNPYPILNEVIMGFITSHEFQEHKSLCAAVYILLDKENEAQKIDPNFEEVELFIQNDSMLLAPIAERLTKIRLREFQRVVSDRTLTSTDIPNNDNKNTTISRNLGALSRTLRTNDWSLAWQIIKESSFVCIAESLRFFKLADWLPISEAEKTLFQYLSEYIGFDGWKECSDVLQEVIIDKNQRFKGIKFEVMNILKNPPPSFILSPSQLEFEEESIEGIQRKFLRVNSNNTTLLIISIPYYFNIEIDKTGIKSIICPLSTLGKNEFNWLLNKTQELSGSTDFFERKVLRYFLALEKLVEMHSERGFVFDCTKSEIVGIPLSDDKENKNFSNKIIIGFDFGNSTTVISCLKMTDHSFIEGKELLSDPTDKVFEISNEGLSLPSLIHYKSGGQKYIGLEAEPHRDEVETFKLMKRSLRRGWSNGIKVEERRIKAPEAAKDFILEISKRIKINNTNIHKICFTAPVDAPIQYQVTIRESISQAFGISESLLEVFDEATAAILGVRENISSNVSTLVVDVGGGTTDLAVVSIKDSSPESSIFYRSSEDLGGADIEGIAFYECRDKVGTDIQKSSKLIEEFRVAKHELVEKGKMKPIKLEISTEPVSFSVKVLNDWLKKERFISRFIALVDDAMMNGKSAGSGEIKQFVLVGGGSKWPLFSELMKNVSNTNHFFHIPDTFAVAKGAMRAGLGLSINTSLPYPLGVLRSDNGKQVFEIIIEKGERIPSSCYSLNFVSVDSLTEHVELDFRRRRIKYKGEKFLLFGNNGEPFMKEGENMVYYEPLSESPLYLSSGQSIDVVIDDKGSLFLTETITKIIHDLGSIL